MVPHFEFMLKIQYYLCACNSDPHAQQLDSFYYHSASCNLLLVNLAAQRE